jgi:hypothetical protein
VFGLVRGALIGLVLTLGLTLFLDPGTSFLTESRITPHLARGARLLAPLLPDGTREVLLDRLDALPEEPREVTI